MKEKLIETIKKSKIVSVIYEPRYQDNYIEDTNLIITKEKFLIGSTIIINTTNTGDKNAKR